jgi:23S rRNA (uracil1939-C5)-methyltransferase
VAEELELLITDLARAGPGVGRDAEGRVVFVPYAAPGDRVRVRITGREKRYAQAELIEVLEPSSERVKPPCAVFGRCGGCQWQHLPYSLQWRTKLRGARHALERVGLRGHPLLERLEELPAQRVWEYRNRVQLRGEGSQLGFYATGSHELVPIQRCEIARPEINAALAAIREEGQAKLRAYKVEVEVLPDGSVRRTWNASHAAGGFRQVHDEQNASLQAWVASAASAGSCLLDLYGGSGNLSTGLADRHPAIHCVDISAPEGTPGPRETYRYHRSAVLPWLESRAQKALATLPAETPRAALLDPPREGLGAELKRIAERLEGFGVRELVLVGCDPDSWARDTFRLTQRGWKLERIGVLDLFPQTRHIEGLALLRL